MCAYVSVGNSSCHPYEAFAVAAFAGEVHYPGFPGVGDCKALAFRAIAISSGEGDYGVYGLSRGLCPLQGYVDQTAVVDASFRVRELGSAAPGGLGDNQLMLIHIAHGLPGMSDLRNSAERAVGVPFGDLQHAAALPVCRGVEVEFSVKDVRVSGVRNYGRPVHACPRRHDDIGAG